MRHRKDSLVSELTEAEMVTLLSVWPWPQEAATTRDGFAAVVEAVAAIVAKREADAEARVQRVEVECPQCASKTSIRAHGLERPEWCGVCGVHIRAVLQAAQAPSQPLATGPVSDPGAER